jgi:hypothetical protein
MLVLINFASDKRFGQRELQRNTTVHREVEA